MLGFSATVCKTVPPYAMGPLYVCPVCDVDVLWPSGWWIKMPLGTEVGLGPGHIVLDGDQLLSKKGQNPSIVGPCLLWPNGWMDQDATWYEGAGLGPGDIVLDVRWGSSSPKRGTAALTFRPMSIVAKRSPSQQLLSTCTQ